MKGKRPWGWYNIIDNGTTYKVKSILVEPTAEELKAKMASQ